MERILWRISGGLRYLVFPDYKGYYSRPHDQQRFVLDILRAETREYKYEPIEIGYERADGSGHCVVAKRLKYRRGDRLEDYRFICYQDKSEGRDMLSDMKESFITFAVSRYLEQSASVNVHMDFYYKTAVDSVAEHVEFYKEAVQ